MLPKVHEYCGERKTFFLLSDIRSLEGCIRSYNRGELKSRKQHALYIEVEGDMDPSRKGNSSLGRKKTVGRMNDRGART